MNRWKFALLSGRGYIKINGQVYKLDEKIYSKQKRAILILSVIIATVIVGLLIIRLFTDYDVGAYCIAAFCLYAFAYYLTCAFLTPKNIEDYITLQESEVTLTNDSVKE